MVWKDYKKNKIALSFEQREYFLAIRIVFASLGERIILRIDIFPMISFSIKTEESLEQSIDQSRKM
jgi:hypothetical protein